jgi:hypothetical protein
MTSIGKQRNKYFFPLIYFIILYFRFRLTAHGKITRILKKEKNFSRSVTCILLVVKGNFNFAVLFWIVFRYYNNAHVKCVSFIFLLICISQMKMLALFASPAQSKCTHNSVHQNQVSPGFVWRSLHCSTIKDNIFRSRKSPPET